MEDKQQIGCVQALAGLTLAPVVACWVVFMDAWVIRKIWVWYPPFGQAAPSIQSLFAMLIVLCLLRGVTAKDNDEHLLLTQAKAVVMGTGVPLLFLVTVLVMRWFCG